MKYHGTMTIPAQYLFAAALLLTPCAAAFAQDPVEESIPAVPLVRPATKAIAAMPLMMPAQAISAEANAGQASQYANLETTYNAAYADWVRQITALSKQEGFDAPYPVDPTGSFYPDFRAIADTGNLNARLWCLRNFQYDNSAGDFREMRWQGEAFSLATALCNDTQLSTELRQSLNSGWNFSNGKAVDQVLAYLQDTTAVEEIRRATMAARSRVMLDQEGENYALGRALAEKVAATWPGSDEAVRLNGMINARDTLVKGGIPANFTGLDVDGREINLYDYRGKIVVVDFWGFW